jgi:hypothetical protein
MRIPLRNANANSGATVPTAFTASKVYVNREDAVRTLNFRLGPLDFALIILAFEHAFRNLRDT